MTSFSTPITWQRPSMTQAALAPGGVVNGKPASTRRLDDGCQDRVAASFELMAALLAEVELPEVLALVVRRAGLMARADLAFMALPGPGPNTLTIEVAAGANADRIRGESVRVGTSVLGKVFMTGRPLALQVATDAPLKGLPLPAGPILLLPLDTGERTCGVLALAGQSGNVSFTASVKRQLRIFASTSASMIEIAEERRGNHLG
jgi:transcriptional regulator with GAF, ATPase, and Fis domain